MAEETKAEKFERMLEGRLPKAIKAVELIGNLSNKSSYDYDHQQAVDMVNQLDDVVADVAQSFGVSFDAPETEEAGGFGVVTSPASSETSIGVVDGTDRRDIRSVVRLMLAEDHGKALQLLQKIVSGWVVPDDVPEDAEPEDDAEPVKDSVMSREQKVLAREVLLDEQLDAIEKLLPDMADLCGWMREHVTAVVAEHEVE